MATKLATLVLAFLPEIWVECFELWLKKTIIWQISWWTWGSFPRTRWPKSRREAEASGVGVVDLLVANKVIRAEDVTQAKAAHFGAEVVNLSEIKIADDVIATIPRHIARKYRVVPVFKHDNALTVALADPSDLDTIDSLTHLLHAGDQPAGGLRGRHRGGAEQVLCRAERRRRRPIRATRKSSRT